jgi:branched-chain amino acid transport system substrate-binding protein
MKRKLRVGLTAAAAASLMAMTLTSCSAPAEGDPGSNAAADECVMGDTIRVALIKDQTGPAAYVGTEARRGAEIAIQEIEESGIIGDTTFELVVSDPAGSAQTAASQVTSAANDQTIRVLLGPIIADQATAVAPIAENGGLPTVFSQAGSDGVVVGPYTYRVTPPLKTFFNRTVDYLAEQGVETLGVLWSSDNPTLTEMAEEVLPPLAEAAGIEIVAANAVTGQTQDLAAPVAATVSSSPDAIALLNLAPQITNAIEQVDRTGYDGIIISNPAAAAGLAQATTDLADGVVWSTNFQWSADLPEAQALTERFEAEFGEHPTNYAAEGYDSMWWVAHALAETGCDSRDSIREGLESVAAAGFSGAQGELRFEGHDARIDGFMVRWEAGQVELVE